MHTCVYIYIWQLSSFRVPTLWFIDLTVITCHIQYTFLSLYQFVSRENGQNTKIFEVHHFFYDMKIVADCYQVRKALIPKEPSSLQSM